MVGQNMTVGQYLQKQREEKKVPLESVAAVTRIKLSQLQALERDEFRLLIAEVFIRGYLRSYAKFLQLSPEEIIALYQGQMEAKRKPSEDVILVAPPPLPHSFLQPIWNHFLNFLYTIAGGSPAFSIKKVLLPPKA